MFTWPFYLALINERIGERAVYQAVKCILNLM